MPSASEPVSQTKPEQSIEEEKEEEEEEEEEEDDSLEDLCNDVMPSPTKEVTNILS